MTIETRSDMTVIFRDGMGGDEAVIEAMLVSSEDDEVTQACLEEKTTFGRINYLMRARHGSPFEHNSLKFYVEAPICVFREWHRHRIGWCLPADSLISVGTWRNGRKKAIGAIYRDWYEGVPDSMGRNRKLPSCRNIVARTFNETTGYIEEAPMLDVYESGIKDLIRIELSSGRSLRCTPEHSVMTDGGWVRAGDLSTGSSLARQGRVPMGERQGIPKRLREGIQVWTTEQKKERVGASDVCYICKGRFPYAQLEMDHVIPVRDNLLKALDPDNLKPACTGCHQDKTNGEGLAYGAGRRALTLGARYERVSSIRSAGSGMTYDISMPAPNHSFIADDFIVHNSYNEMSGRYKELAPTFYVPDASRALVQEGKPGHYIFVPGTPEQHERLVERLTRSYEASYAEYQESLDEGVAKEIARLVLPVGIYSAMYATTNARALMAFLSLRTKDEDSKFPSYPQREIEMCAEIMERHFAERFPLVYRAFNENGRVAP